MLITTQLSMLLDKLFKDLDKELSCGDHSVTINNQNIWLNPKTALSKDEFIYINKIRRQLVKDLMYKSLKKYINSLPIKEDDDISFWLKDSEAWEKIDLILKKSME